MPSDSELYDIVAAGASSDLDGYLAYLIADSRPPKRLKKILEPWQKTLYGILKPLFRSAAGHATTDKKAAFITAPRGSSKTSTVAHFLNWILCFAARNVSVTAAAADRDQSRILLERMRSEAGQNPWLARRLKFLRSGVSGPTGTLEVISSDAPTSSGRLDDVLIFDELCFWKKRDLFDILMSGRAKRRDAVLVILSNAGCVDTWQHELWKQAQGSARWITHEVPAFSASWLDKAAIEEDKRLLLPTIYKRLHLNQWVDLAVENAFVTRAQIEACMNCERQTEGKPKVKYVAAVDYAAVYDRTAACVCHLEGDDVYLDDMAIWQGSHSERMQIKSLEDWIETRLRTFRLSKLVADPYQLEQTCQRFERRLEVERYSFGGSHHWQLGENLRSLIINKRLHVYPDAAPLTLPSGVQEDLVDEVAALVVEERNGGRWRFQHLDGKHDDRTIVLAMSSLACVRIKKTVDPTGLIEALNKKPLTGDTEMDYAEVKKINAFHTWQACPVIAGEELRLKDYDNKDMAAWAVNCVHELLESKPPNVLDASRMPPETKRAEIRADLVKTLTARKLLPLARPKKKEPAAK